MYQTPQNQGQNVPKLSDNPKAVHFRYILSTSIKSGSYEIACTKMYQGMYQEAGQNPLGTFFTPPPIGGGEYVPACTGVLFVDKTNPVSGCFLSIRCPT